MNYLQNSDYESKIRWKRKILLFVENCPAYNIISNCQAIKVKFVPPNTTLKSHPLDQGIIKMFKTLYIMEIVRKIISHMDDDISTVIDILQAIVEAHYW